MSSIEELIQARGWSDEEARLRSSICEIGRLCYSRNYIVGADGNISGRLADGTILITPAGAMKGFLAPEQIAHVDMQGRTVDNGPKASTNPWMAKGLEWEKASSPPVTANFETPPVVTEEAYNYPSQLPSPAHH